MDRAAASVGGRFVQPHRSVGGLEVAGDGAGREVHPAADVAVAEKAVVRFVGVGLHDGRLDLAAHAAFGADGRAAANPGMRVDAGPAADPDRTVEADEGADLSAGINHDRPVPHDDLLRDRCAVGGEETGSNLAEAS